MPHHRDEHRRAELGDYTTTCCFASALAWCGAVVLLFAPIAVARYRRHD
jgi:hypothetical protein